MADSLPHVVIPPDTWVDLYDATGITVGVPIAVENVGVFDVLLVVSPTQPPAPDTKSGNDAFNISKRTGDKLRCESGASGAWAYCDNATGKVSVRRAEVGEGFYPELSNLTISGVTIGSVTVKDSEGVLINPSNREKQQEIINALLATTVTEDEPSVDGQKGIPVMGVRNDADVALTDTDGDETRFSTDATGRQKVRDDVALAQLTSINNELISIDDELVIANAELANQTAELQDINNELDNQTLQLGSEGGSPPSIPGIGIIGYLRALYDKFTSWFSNVSDGPWQRESGPFSAQEILASVDWRDYDKDVSMYYVVSATGADGDSVQIREQASVNGSDWFDARTFSYVVGRDSIRRFPINPFGPNYARLAIDTPSSALTDLTLTSMQTKGFNRSTPRSADSELTQDSHHDISVIAEAYGITSNIGKGLTAVPAPHIVLGNSVIAPDDGLFGSSDPLDNPSIPRGPLPTNASPYVGQTILVPKQSTGTLSITMQTADPTALHKGRLFIYTGATQNKMLAIPDSTGPGIAVAFKGTNKQIRNFQIINSLLRVEYVPEAGTAALSTFELETTASPYKYPGSVGRRDAKLDTNTDLVINKSFIEASPQAKRTFLGADREIFGSGVTGQRIRVIGLRPDKPLANNRVTTTLTSGGATVTQEPTFAEFRLNSGVSATSLAHMVTVKINKYRPGSELYLMVPVRFTQGVANTQQIVGMFTHSAGVPQDGFGFGFNGIDFGAFRFRGGVSEFVPMDDWGTFFDATQKSEFVRDGVPELFDFSLKNIYKLRAGLLGSSDVFLDIQAPDGNWQEAYAFEFPNSDEKASILTWDLPFQALIRKTSADTTQLIVGVGSVNAGWVGDSYGLEAYDVDGREEYHSSLSLAGQILPVNGSMTAPPAGRQIRITDISVNATTLLSTGGTLTIGDGPSDPSPYTLQIVPGTNQTKQGLAISQTFKSPRKFLNAPYINTSVALGVGGGISVNIEGYHEAI